jgi:hypothetical protein
MGVESRKVVRDGTEVGASLVRHPLSDEKLTIPSRTDPLPFGKKYLPLPDQGVSR